MEFKTVFIVAMLISLFGCKQNEQLIEQKQTIDSLSNETSLLRLTINELTNQNESLQATVSNEKQINKQITDSLNHYKSQYEIIYAQAEKSREIPPTIGLHPLKNGKVNFEQCTDSISISRLAEFEIDSSDTNAIYNGFRIDFDNDGIKDVVILKYFQKRFYLSEIFFYKKTGVEYQRAGYSRINDRVDPVEFYKSVTVNTIDHNQFPDFYVHSSTGASGGGHSSYILQWKENEIHHSNVLTTGKSTWLRDIDGDEMLEMVHVDYFDRNVHQYHNGRQGVQVFQYIDYRIIDMTSEYGHIEEKLRAELR